MPGTSWRDELRLPAVTTAWAALESKPWAMELLLSADDDTTWIEAKALYDLFVYVSAPTKLTFQLTGLHRCLPKVLGQERCDKFDVPQKLYRVQDGQEIFYHFSDGKHTINYPNIGDPSWREQVIRQDQVDYVTTKLSEWNENNVSAAPTLQDLLEGYQQENSNRKRHPPSNNKTPKRHKTAPSDEAESSAVEAEEPTVSQETAPPPP
jgi:hypothetical protein